MINSLLQASDSNFIDFLAQGADSGRLETFDRAISGFHQYLRSSYRRSGQPLITVLAADPGLRVINACPLANRSIASARFLGFVSDVLIAGAQNPNDLALARKLAEQAIGILDNVDRSERSRLSLYVMSTLFWAVANKAVGKREEAILGMRRMSKMLISRFDSNQLELLPLLRQEALIFQDDWHFARLIDTLTEIKNRDPVEYYGTLKRVVEYLLNKHSFSKANYLENEFKRAFLKARHELSPISHVSFAKNIGHLRMVQGRTDNALVILNEVREHALQRGLLGQVRQAEYLLADILDGRAPSLAVFKV